MFVAAFTKALRIVRDVITPAGLTRVVIARPTSFAVDFEVFFSGKQLKVFNAVVGRVVVFMVNVFIMAKRAAEMFCHHDAMLKFSAVNGRISINVLTHLLALTALPMPRALTAPTLVDTRAGTKARVSIKDVNGVSEKGLAAGLASALNGAFRWYSGHVSSFQLRADRARAVTAVPGFAMPNYITSGREE